MSAGSEAVLYDIDGDPMAVENGAVIPVLTSVLVGGGSDGTNARFIKVDSSGNQIIIGFGVAGTPAGGVLTIQGDPAGTAIPISGTVTANAGSGNFSVVQATAALLNATVTGTVIANIGTTGGLALDATLAKLTITPGTAIGANTLAMVGGHVTTVSPTYTNGNINQLSLTTAGALRIDGSAVIHPVSQSGTWTVQQGTPPWSIVGTAADGTPVTGNPVLMGGQDGTNVQSIFTDPQGSQYTVNAGAPSNATRGIGFGRVIGIQNTLLPVRGTIYNQQSTNAQRSMASNSATDNSAGIGARTVKITYYTATMTGPFTETITMNGTTPVNTSNTDICFIEKMEVMSVGSNSSNVGIITLYVSTGGAGGIIGNIGTGNIVTGRGDNQTLWAHHYVASGITTNITSYVSGSNGNQGAASFLMALDPTVSTSPEKIISDAVATASSTMSVVRNLIVPIRILGPSRVTLYIVALGNNTQFFGGFDFWEL